MEGLPPHLMGQARRWTSAYGCARGLLTPLLRLQVVTWLLNASDMMNLLGFTSHLAVRIFDYYLAMCKDCWYPKNREQLKTDAHACLWIACKFNEVDGAKTFAAFLPVVTEDYDAIVQGDTSSWPTVGILLEKRGICEAESRVLKTIDYDVYQLTTWNCCNFDQEATQVVAILDLMLLDYELLRFAPWTLADSAQRIATHDFCDKQRQDADKQQDTLQQNVMMQFECFLRQHSVLPHVRKFVTERRFSCGSCPDKKRRIDT